MKEKVLMVLAFVGMTMVILGFCSLDSENFIQVAIFTLVGMGLVAIGGLGLQIFD